MSLNSRQRRLYKHRCNIWRCARSVSGGVPGAETFTLAYSDVPCYYEYTPNVDDPIEQVGRVKRMTLVTTDVVHFDVAQELADNWLLVNRTLQANGSRSPAYGEVHRILGAPRVIVNEGGRQPNKRSVMAMSMEHPPEGVS